MRLEQALERVVEREKRHQASYMRNTSIMEHIGKGRSHDAIARLHGVSGLYVQRLAARCGGEVMVRPRVRRNIPGLCQRQSAVLSLVVTINQGDGAMPILKELAYMADLTLNDVTWCVRKLRQMGLLEPARDFPGNTSPTAKGIAMATGRKGQ